MNNTELEARSLVVTFESSERIEAFEVVRFNAGGSEERLALRLEGLDSKAGRLEAACLLLSTGCQRFRRLIWVI